MTNLNDVLLAMSNIPVDDPIAEIWGRGLQGEYKIIKYTGALPITINANGKTLIDYCIYGNTVQNGTPTPENPIMPIGCGELEATGVHAGQYKLPILSNSTVTNIYLGEVETIRRIYKTRLVNPTSVIKVDNGYRVTFLLSSHPAPSYVTGRGVCNIAKWNGNYDNIGFVVSTTRAYITQDITEWATKEEATVWFNEHEVYIWYVLAEPETGIVNEPLMKIGNYADTIDSAQANVQIPTSKGTTVIDYDGTTKPSQMYIKYFGRVKND